MWKAPFHSISEPCARTVHQILCQSHESIYVTSFCFLWWLSRPTQLIHPQNISVQAWMPILSLHSKQIFISLSEADNRRWKSFRCSFRAEERAPRSWRDERWPADVTSPVNHRACVAYQITSQPKTALGAFVRRWNTVALTVSHSLSSTFSKSKREKMPSYRNN